jgi:hypothetical protein
LDEAWGRAQEEIARSTFQLPDDACEAIDRIYREAQGWLLKQ